VLTDEEKEAEVKRLKDLIEAKRIMREDVINTFLCFVCRYFMLLSTGREKARARAGAEAKS
jgi:hypothetical protein